MTAPSHRPALRAAPILLFAVALVLPATSNAKRKKDYSDKLYNGVSIEEYCSELLSVEAFDLSDEDLETCDERYKDELDSLDDVDLGDIDLGGSSGSSADLGDDDDEAASDEPKLSKKDLGAHRLAAGAAEKKRHETPGIVSFAEAPPEQAEDTGEGDEEHGADFGGQARD